MVLILIPLFICFLCDIECHLTIYPYDMKQTYAVFFNILDSIVSDEQMKWLFDEEFHLMNLSKLCEDLSILKSLIY